MGNKSSLDFVGAGLESGEGRGGCSRQLWGQLLLPVLPESLLSSVCLMQHKLALGLLLLAALCLFFLSSGTKDHCYFYVYCAVFSGVLGAVGSDQ